VRIFALTLNIRFIGLYGDLHQAEEIRSAGQIRLGGQVFRYALYGVGEAFASNATMTPRTELIEAYNVSTLLPSR
jgi:hypothetical protein